MCICRPVKLLRLVMAVVFKVFYITVLNYLLGPLNCSWLVTAKVHYNVDFPTESEQQQAQADWCITEHAVVALSWWFVELRPVTTAAVVPNLSWSAYRTN